MPKELDGITDARARTLYLDSVKELSGRGHDNAATRDMLRSAAEWTQEASDLHRRITEATNAGGEEGVNVASLRGLIKMKAMCEGECRKILSDLLLTPQKARGRPPKEAEAESEEDDGGWSAFDEDGGDAP